MGFGRGKRKWGLRSISILFLCGMGWVGFGCIGSEVFVDGLLGGGG